MATPRRQQICLDETPYYHCISRCVRRAFLCGIDKLTGRSYEHRRDFIETKLHRLVAVFSIDVAAYAIMSNHYHVVLRVDVAKAQRWSDDEVLKRWAKLFKLPAAAESMLRGEVLGPFERCQAQRYVATYRSRLINISWFMKCLNTDIARAANKEDDCTGRFFEGRFRCQALLDEAALLKCMAYVDLNPVRAKVATSAERATHTSIAHRLSSRAETLLPFAGEIASKNEASASSHLGATPHIPFRFADYRALLSWSTDPSREAMPARTQSLLRAHGIDRATWRAAIHGGEISRFRVLGAANRMAAFAKAVGQGWLWGSSRSHEPAKASC